MLGLKLNHVGKWTPCEKYDKPAWIFDLRFQKLHNKSARCVPYVVSRSDRHAHSNVVIVELSAISCYIGPWYNKNQPCPILHASIHASRTVLLQTLCSNNAPLDDPLKGCYLMKPSVIYSTECVQNGRKTDQVEFKCVIYKIQWAR